MGRRIPSFEKIEQIAAALEIPSYELFRFEPSEKKQGKKLKAKDYLQKIPADIKKEIISHLLSQIKKNINTSFDLNNY